jgi:flagellar hook-associated protein 2
MSDIYVPGVKSRFNTEKLVEDLMRVERLPKERIEKAVEGLKTEKTYWQEVGRRIGSLRDSARLLFSFQNPFSDRIVRSQNEAVITGTALREAEEQERDFTIRQIAQADRFLSSPLESSFAVPPGNYGFSVGQEEVSFRFRGGTLPEFAEALNRRGRGKVQAQVIAVQSGTQSLLIESAITGADNRLVFSGDAEALALRTGLAEPDHSYRNIPVSAPGGEGAAVSAAEDTLKVGAGGNARVPINPGASAASELVLGFEALSALLPEEPFVVPEPPPGPSLSPPGSATYGDITIENEVSSVELPPWNPPSPPPRVDDREVLALRFSDGATVPLPPLPDGRDFQGYQYRLADLAPGKTLVSLDLTNRNTHRDIALRNVRIFDPHTTGGLRPLNPVSTAQDAVLVMDGIEISRPRNVIDDLIPSVTVSLKGPSEGPVRLGIEPDREGIKESIIALVGNYNRLMAEVNVLTRNDDRVVEELSYLDPEEREGMQARLGVFSGDSTLNQFKNGLQRTVTSPYPTAAGQDLALLTQLGIGTDVRRAGATTGYDPSRLRGYLEIDEKALDAALENNLPAIQELFGSDTDGDMIVDTGIAYALDRLARPYVETGGLISLKTSGIDSRISQEERRIQTMERQLSAREATLRSQYGQMEGAYNRMEQMTGSLDAFSRQSSTGNNR